MDMIIALFSIVVAFAIGTIVEKNHYKSIKKRELELYKQPFLSLAKQVNPDKKVLNACLVSSSVVLGCDHFKAFFASLKNIFGGNISVYESVLDRGRREAILRIREKAKKMNADIVLNVKVDTIMLNTIDVQRHQKVCVVAYGTAIKYAK